MPNLKQLLETKTNKRTWSPKRNKRKHGKASVQELLATLKSREEDQTHQWQTQSKSIENQTPDQNKQQAYLIGMVDSGTIEPTSLMTTHVKGH